MAKFADRLKLLFNLIELTTDLERRLWLVVIHFNPLHFHFRLCWFFLCLYWLFHATHGSTRNPESSIFILAHREIRVRGNINLWLLPIVKNVYRNERRSRWLTLNLRIKALRFCWLNKCLLSYYSLKFEDIIASWRYHSVLFFHTDNNLSITRKKNSDFDFILGAYVWAASIHFGRIC